MDAAGHASHSRHPITALPGPQGLLSLVFQRVAHKIGVALRLDVEIDGLHDAVVIRDEGAAGDAHIGLTVHALLDPDAVARGSCRPLIGKEEEGEVIVLPELQERRHGVRADADDVVAQAVEIGLQITEGHCFERSAVGIRLREVEEHEPAMVADEIGDAVRRAVRPGEREIGQRLADGGQGAWGL
jgi:hypothetical protein